MKHGKKLGLVFLGVILFWGLLSALALAQGLEIDYPTIPGIPPLGEKPLLPEYIRYLYNFSIIIAGLVAFFSFVYGGFRYITSVGHPVAMADAREQITAGIVGLIIILGSYLLLTTINPQLTILQLSKPSLPELEKCDCTLSPDDLSDHCKNFCKGIIVPTNVYKMLEVPIGTLIEEYALNEETFNKIKTEVENTRGLSEIVKQKAEELENLLKDNCRCGNTSSSCLPDCSGGECSGDPCRNRPSINAKRAELRAAYLALENQLLVLYPVIASYKADVLRLLIAKVLLEEGLWALNYDNLLEVKQTIVEAGGSVEIKHLTILGREIPGYQDPANFYFDYEVNEELIGQLLLYLESEIGLWGTIGGGIGGNIFHVPPGTQIFTWPVSGSGTCLSGWYDTYNPAFYAGGCHRAIDISAPRDTSVVAARDGKVSKIEDRGDVSLGLFIVLEHQFGTTTFYTVYAHLDKTADGLAIGDDVSQGEVIGYVNSSGASTGDHLHFALQTGSAPEGIAYDPLLYLPSPADAGIADPCTGISLWPREPDICTAPIPDFIPTGTGLCSPENLEPIWGDYAGEASCVCQAESGGNKWALNDGCLSGVSCEWSVGLFQLNIIYECAGITAHCPTCTVTDRPALDNCARQWGWGNATKNSQEAWLKFQDRGWQPWTGAKICGLIP